MNEQELLEQGLAMISQLMGQLETEAFDQEGFSELTMAQLHYLETIANTEQPTVSQLANKLEVTKPSVTAAIQKLDQMGYVEKVQSQTDRRVYHILLAPKGKHFTALHDHIHRLLAARLVQDLDKDEVQQFAKLFRKIIGKGETI